MCADCVCSVAGDCVLMIAIVRFDVKNAIGHVSCWKKFDNCVFAPNVVKNTPSGWLFMSALDILQMQVTSKELNDTKKHGP